MTRLRRDGGGQETPFGEWVRSRKGLDSVVRWMDVCDADWIFHRYKIHDGKQGTRKVRQIMLVEVKTFGKMPTKAQMETLWFWHQLTWFRAQGKKKGLLGLPGNPEVEVWCHGVFVLQLDSATPEIGAITWHVFGKDGGLKGFEVDENGLEAILRFDRRPNEPMRRLSVRQHHKTNETTELRTMPLGFVVEQIVKTRS